MRKRSPKCLDCNSGIILVGGISCETNKKKNDEINDKEGESICKKKKGTGEIKRKLTISVDTQRKFKFEFLFPGLMNSPSFDKNNDQSRHDFVEERYDRINERTFFSSWTNNFGCYAQSRDHGYRTTRAD